MSALYLRAWYNGSTKASQALDEGSIPFARTKNRTDQSVGYIFGHVKQMLNQTRKSCQRQREGSEQAKRSERGP